MRVVPSAGPAAPVAVFVAVFVVGGAVGCPNEVPNPGGKGKADDVVAEPPRLFVDPPFGLGFDCVTIGCDVERRLVVENRGGGTIKLALVRLGVATATDFQLRRGDGAPLPFDAATAVTVDAENPLELFVRYAPSDGVDDEGEVLIDWYDGMLAFDDAVLTRATLPLSTRALGSVAASLAQQRLNFGFVPVGGYGVRDIVIENRGNGGVLSVGPVTLGDGTAAVFLDPDPASDTNPDDVGAWAEQFVNPGAAAHIPVKFRPNGPGVFQGSVFVVTNDGANPAFEVEVAGTAVEEASAAVLLDGVAVSGPIDFGTVRTGVTRNVNFAVQNQGGNALTLTATGVGADFAVFPGDAQTVRSLESAPFTAVWTPTVGGLFAAQAVIATSDPARPTVVVDATGFATAPSLSASPSAVDFGGVVQGWTTGAQTFFLTNTGFGDLTISSVTFEVGSSDQIRFASVPPLPAKLSPTDPPLAISVFMEASVLGTANAVVLVGTDSIDNQFGSGGVARLSVFGRVITCEEGCPVQNGVPSCGTGSCQIGSCDNRFHDADDQFGSGCECGEDLVPGGGGTRRDIDGFCGGRDIGTMTDCDNPKRVTIDGTLSDLRDVDLYFARFRDDSCCFLCDDFHVEVFLENPLPGMRLCLRTADDGVGCGGENQRRCDSTYYNLGGNLNVFGDDDASDVTAWVEWAPDAQPVCGPYRITFDSEG